MNTRQAAQTLAVLQSGFRGRLAEDDLAAELWLARIEAVPFETGRAAVSALIDNQTHPPAIAEWQTACREIARREVPGESLRALGSGPADRGGAARLLAEMDRAKEDRKARRGSMTADEFIRSEGHDPATHRLSRSGFVLRRARARKRPITERNP